MVEFAKNVLNFVREPVSIVVERDEQNSHFILIC